MDTTVLTIVANHQRLLRERLRLFLQPLHPDLQKDVIAALESPGKLLAPSRWKIEHEGKGSDVPSGIWSILTVVIAQLVAPDIDLLFASSVALSVECCICAGDLLDDVEDEDRTDIVQQLGAARTLNVSTALLVLSQEILFSLVDQGVPGDRVLALSRIMQDTLLIATAGQHRDLLAEQSAFDTYTLERCIDITAMKSGALMSLPFHLGALCAGADEQMCRKFAELGRLLGIAAQLDNDCRDLYYTCHERFAPIDLSGGGASTKAAYTDLARRKKTLPIVLAMQADTSSRPATHNDGQAIGIDIHAINEGIVAAHGICLLYQERVHDCLQEIAIQYPPSPVLRLLLQL